MARHGFRGNRLNGDWIYGHKWLVGLFWPSDWVGLVNPCDLLSGLIAFVRLIVFEGHPLPLGHLSKVYPTLTILALLVVVSHAPHQPIRKTPPMVAI
jgi:hypothetical protein